jgi:hypothetical protein
MSTPPLGMSFLVTSLNSQKQPSCVIELFKTRMLMPGEQTNKTLRGNLVRETRLKTVGTAQPNFKLQLQ